VSHLTSTVPSRTGNHPAGTHLPATNRPVAGLPVRTGDRSPVAGRVATTTPPAPTGAVVAPLPRPVLALVPTGPAGPTGPTDPSDPTHRGAPADAASVTSVASTRTSSDDGSLVAEYGLLAVVAATVAGVLISWASSGALASFFGQLLEHARSLVVS
jgi:hypothetical protein